jgi:16S rRNA (guanine(527)-N(7))-methyltransferase RsmG
MDRALSTWMNEVRLFNKRLHLVSSSMEKTLGEQVRDTMELLSRIREDAVGDLGSGSGFLGIPYKILHPDAHVWLVERSAKKCLFLRHVVEKLGLKDVEVVEADPLKKAVGPFPALMSRSFSPKESLIQAVLRTCTLPGKFYYIQTGDPEGLSNPGLTLEDRASLQFKGYTLNLDAYLVTSR